MKFYLSTLIIILSLSTNVFAQQSGSSVYQACSEVFNYSFQVKKCIEKAVGPRAVYACGMLDYDYQKFDCLETKRRGPVVNACIKGFNYDFQRFDCMEEAVGNGRAVRACIKGFNYDFQRFDCLRIALNGRVTEWCIENNSFDSKKFKCIRDYQGTPDKI